MKRINTKLLKRGQGCMWLGQRVIRKSRKVKGGNWCFQELFLCGFQGESGAVNGGSRAVKFRSKGVKGGQGLSRCQGWANTYFNEGFNGDFKQAILRGFQQGSQWSKYPSVM